MTRDKRGGGRGSKFKWHHHVFFLYVVSQLKMRRRVDVGLFQVESILPSILEEATTLLTLGLPWPWQWMQCIQTAQWPILLANVARNFRAGPNFIFILLIKCSSVSKGSAAPSIDCSRNVYRKKREKKKYYNTFVTPCIM